MRLGNLREAIGQGQLMLSECESDDGIARGFTELPSREFDDPARR